jgi:predicted phage tail protein
MKAIRGAGGGGGGGGKGGGNRGGGSYTPSTTPDNLDSTQFAEVIDLLSEGEIEGFPSAAGFARGSDAYNIALLKDVYLDNTPILRAGADPNAPQPSDYNFQNLTIFTRYGTQDQEFIPLSRTLQSEYAVGVKIEKDIPVTRTVSTAGVNGVRVTLSTPQLQEFSDKNDIFGNTIEFGIELAYDGGPFVRVITDKFTGRTTDLYQREFRLNFTGSLPVDVRVVRITPDYTTSNKVGDLFWSSYTEISYARLRYPNSALVGLRVDARQFSNIPARSYRIRGIKVRIPSNASVNSTTGQLTYTGIWNGTFAQAQWTTDPAWCLYDLLTSKRYGAGNHIDETKLDKWDFYAASQYCGQNVINGFGGTEPRFSCNVNIQTLDEAYNVINQMASVFRAMPYWSAGAIAVTQDKPQDSAYLFNQSNVTEEGFTYSGSALKTRHTVAIVKYLDLNARDASFEVVENQEAIARYGVIKAEIDAFACTSRGQARRLGEWLLYSEQYETETVSFATSLEAGIIVRPGQVIEIADPVRSGERTGGRIVEATSTTVTVDNLDSIRFSGAAPTLSVVLPDGSVETKALTNRTDNVFTTDAPFSQTPQPGAVWIYQDSGIKTQLFRVLAVEEQDGVKYAITALAYNPSKYDFIERDVPLVTRDISNLNEPPAPPSELKANELLYESNGQVLSKIIVSWRPVSTATSYRVRYRFADGNWVSGDTTAPDFEITNSNVGRYSIEVLSLSAALRASAPTPLTFDAIGKTAPPVTIPDLFIAPIDDKNAELYWPQSVDLDVRVGGEIRIRHSPLVDGTATWGRSNDIVPAVNGSSTRKIVPLLEGTYFIRAVDSLGNESAGVASVVVDLPAPQDAFVVQEYREEDNSPPFNGTTTSMSYSSEESGLILASGTLVDDMAPDGDWDALSLIDYIGGAVSEGSYQFSETLDLGAVFDVDIRNILRTRAYEPGNLWDDRVENVDLWTTVDGDDLGQANCSLFVRTTTANPSSAPTWSSWQPFVNNTARGRGFQFKLVATSSNKGENVVVEQLGVVTTFQRRTETQRNLTSGAASYSVTFPTAFYTVPSIGITAQDMEAGDYFTISSVTRSGFAVTFRNSGGSMVSKVFDYQAVGHGRQIT